MADDSSTATATPPQPIPTEASPPLTTMLQGPSAQDVLSATQANQAGPPPPTADVANAPQMGGQSAPVMSTPTPPDVQEHFSVLHRILDKVGSILGGDETMKITRDKDGNMQISKEPSTMGEKWGRVAAAALGGAGAGLANSQGPGGLQRATAAGIQTGLGQAKQRQTDADQQLSQAEKVQQFNASKALTQQQIAMNTFKMQQMGWGLTEEQSNRANAMQDWITSNPGNKKVGDFDNEADAIKYENEHGDLISGHVNGQFHTEAIQGADGKPKVRLFTMDKAWLDQKLDKTQTYKQLVAGDTLDAPATLKDHEVKAGSMTNRDFEAAQEGETKKILDYQVKINEEKDKVATAKQAATDREQAERDRTQTAREAAADRRQSHEDSLQLQRQIAEGKGYISGEPTPPAPAGTYDAKYPPVQNFARNTVGIVPRQIGKVPAKVQNNADLARNLTENTDAALKIMNRRQDLFGPAAGRITNFDEMLGSNDGDMRDFAQRMSNIAKATVGIHGSKSKDLVHDEEQKLFNNFKAGPDGIKGAMGANRDSAQTFLDSEQNFLHYGTATGPDRSYDVSRQKQQTLPPAKDYSKVQTDGKGNFKELQGNAWVDVAPPPTGAAVQR